MTTTTNLSLTLVEQAQAQKEVTVNAALVRLDALMNRGAQDKDLATPPGSPSAGDLYIVGNSATDDWAGKEGQIAYYEQLWRFIVPNAGMRIFVADEGTLYAYDGTNWLPEHHLLRTVSITASSGSALEIDAHVSLHDVTLDDACTLSISNAPASGNVGLLTLLVRQDATGSRTITWPAAVKWAGGSAPTLTTTAGALDIIALTTHDAGTTWLEMSRGLDVG